MYFIEPDLVDSRLCYIYEDKLRSKQLKVTIYNDFNLAREIVEFLNRKTEALILEYE